MGNRALRRVGLLSYGVYVYHWPIFLWIDQLHTGLGIWVLTPIKFALTWVVAVVSYYHLERPIRRGELPFGLQGRTWSRDLAIGWAVPVAFLVVGMSALVITATAPPAPYDFAATQRTLANLGAGKTSTRPASTGASALPIAKVGAYGDSTALVVGGGILYAAPSTGGVEEVSGGAWVGCGLGIGGYYRSTVLANYEGHTRPECDAWPATYARVINKTRPDLALMLVAPWDVMDRKLAGDDKWRSFGDPVYDRWFQSEMLRAVDVLTAHGATVVWLTSPQVANIPSPRRPPQRARRGATQPAARQGGRAGLREVPRLDRSGQRAPARRHPPERHGRDPGRQGLGDPPAAEDLGRDLPGARVADDIDHVGDRPHRRDALTPGHTFSSWRICAASRRSIGAYAGRRARLSSS